MTDAPDDSIALFMETMQQLLVGGGAREQDIVLPERLDRSRLDFSRESLHVIDDYLNEVHDSGDTAAGFSLLTTIWATALYVGEIIRRAAPERQYQWVAMNENEAPATGATTEQFDLGSLHALRGADGAVCLPSRAVLRVILRGRKARSVHSFARGAIEASDNLEPPPASTSGANPVGAFAN